MPSPALTFDLVIDLHCHVLPGIDDGPGTIEESVELARAAHRSGVRTIVATPHVSPHYPNDAATIAELVDRVNDRLNEERIELEVRAGAEIAITIVSELDAQELERLRLDDSEWILLEPPFTPIAAGIDGVIFELHRAGHKVLLAHPERSPAFQREPKLLGDLARAGVLMSVTAGALAGRFGNTARRFALQLFRDGLVHNVASDAHDLVRRPPGIAEELAGAKLSALTAWLTEAVPNAILAGDEIPAPPARAAARPRGYLGGWLRR